MNRLTKLLAATLVLTAGVAFAKVAATDPNVIARQDLMKTIGGATKTLGDMAGGKTAFDAAAAEAAKAALIASAADIEAKFTPTSTDPADEAKPEVWTDWAGFLTKAKALSDAATAMDTSSAETIGAGMAGVGGTCKDCHTAFRM
ncbi:MAG: c-type cytochrome [Paracoccaceae bacterium]